MAIDIVRAWKDPEYRKTLTADELASLPANPAGTSELTKEQLGDVAGGTSGTVAIGCQIPNNCHYK